VSSRRPVGSEGSHFTLYSILKFFIFLVGAAIRMPFLGAVQYKTTRIGCTKSNMTATDVPHPIVRIAVQ
jgi:hypothetical protein